MICKQAGLVWKRVRKSLRTKRNQKDFDVEQENIKELLQQHKDNQLNLCYFDESGFTLEPAFLMHGNCQIKQSKFLARKVNGSMYWALLTEIVNLIHLSSRERLIPQSWWLVLMNFLRTKIPTVLIIDNASTHTSNEFKENIERWTEANLTIYPTLLLT